MAIVKENQSQEEASRAIGATPQAIKLTDLFGRCSSQGSWSGPALEYLNEIRKLLEDPSRPNKADMKYLSDEAVVFSIDNNSVVLVRDTDFSNLQALVTDVRLYSAREQFNQLMRGQSLLNIVTVNRYMYDRAPQMAAYLTQTLTAVNDNMISDLSLSDFDNYQVNIDTEMSNVRGFFSEHSPSPVVAGDFGFIAGVSDKVARGSYSAPVSKAMFAVTGYVEFIQNESNNTFTPIVHVTDILSVMSSAKILALAMPLIAEIFITRGLWRYPFSSFGKTEINIGNLLVDHKTQQLYSVTNDFDMKKMISEYINMPILTIDVKSGAPTIPGLTMLTRIGDHTSLANQIFQFVGAPNPAPGVAIGENIFREIVGVFETGKNRIGSNLTDTRDLNYLNLVAKLKWSPKIEALKSRFEADPTKRWAYLIELVGDAGMVPTHHIICTYLYREFVQNLSSMVASRLTVSIPSLNTTPSIDFSGLMGKAFAPGHAMFGSQGLSNMNAGFLKF